MFIFLPLFIIFYSWHRELDRDIRTIFLPSTENELNRYSHYKARAHLLDDKSRNKAGIFQSLLDESAQQYVVSVGVEAVEY